jgi:hypothetical protein
MLILMAVAGLEGGEEPAGKDPPPDSDPFSEVEFGKNLIRLSSKNKRLETALRREKVPR